MSKITDKLDVVASKLEEKGLVDKAQVVDAVSDALENTHKTASEELIASDYEMLEMAFREVDAANQEIADAQRIIEAAGKRKKKWIQGVDLKKGKFTTYCKAQGFEGPCQECADKALKSDDPSTRGMASFYLATKKMRKQKRKGKESSLEALKPSL